MNRNILSCALKISLAGKNLSISFKAQINFNMSPADSQTLAKGSSTCNLIYGKSNWWFEHEIFQYRVVISNQFHIE